MGQPSIKANARRVVASLDGADVLAPGPEFVPRSYRPGETKFHIRNIPYSTTEADLREFFASVGPITELHIFVDCSTGRSRGFAVLRVVGDALTLNGAMFQGRDLRIERWDRE